jgi:hypothetical protein
MQRENFVYKNNENESNTNYNLLLALSVGLLIIAIIYAFFPTDKRNNELRPKSKEKKSVDEITPAEAITLGEVVQGPDGKPTIEVTNKEDPDGKDKVVKMRADPDNEIYFVSASLPDKKKAANTLAEVSRRSQYLLQSLDEMLDGNGRTVAKDGTDITENMRRLVKKHYNKKIPYAEYHNPHDKTVGSNSAKGELIEVCLRNKYDTNQWNSVNTIFRVQVHELAHSADKEFREDGDHGPVFNRLMNFLLQTSENLGIYNCAEYKKSGRAYCGLTLTEVDTDCN